jgi:hypothetical protein
MSGRIRLTLSVCSLVLWFVPTVGPRAQAVDSTHPIKSPQTLSPVVMRVRGISPEQVGIGKTVLVQVDSLREAMRRDSVDPRRFVLYLNGHPIWNVRGELVDATRGILEFRLARADTSKEAWIALLGSPRSMQKKGVAVGVGYGESSELESVAGIPAHVTLTVVEGPNLVAASILVLLFLGGFLALASKSNIIRDSSPPDPPSGKQKPYSLSRLQMAVWFFLVFVAFVFLYLITHGVDTLNEQALLLIGIGTGTALGAVLVDNSKQGARESKLAELRPESARLTAEIVELQKAISTPARAAAAPVIVPPDTSDGAARSTVADFPAVHLAERSAQLKDINAEIAEIEASRSAPVSAGFLNDILSDAGGISFHRFQILAWTSILGLVFIYSVWERLAMPEFSATLLALMGISAGTYLGFKVPEKEG